MHARKISHSQSSSRENVECERPTVEVNNNHNNHNNNVNASRSVSSVWEPFQAKMSAFAVRPSFLKDLLVYTIFGYILYRIVNMRADYMLMFFVLGAIFIFILLCFVLLARIEELRYKGDDEDMSDYSWDSDEDEATPAPAAE